MSFVNSFIGYQDVVAHVNFILAILLAERETFSTGSWIKSNEKRGWTYFGRTKSHTYLHALVFCQFVHICTRCTYRLSFSSIFCYTFFCVRRRFIRKFHFCFIFFLFLLMIFFLLAYNFTSFDSFWIIIHLVDKHMPLHFPLYDNMRMRTLFFLSLYICVYVSKCSFIEIYFFFVH